MLSRVASRANRLIVVLFVSCLFGAPLMAVGGALGSSPSASSASGSADARLHTDSSNPFGGGVNVLSGQITDQGDLALPLIPFIAGPSVLSNGATVFGNQIQLYVYNLAGFNNSLKVTVYEKVNDRGLNGTRVINQVMIAAGRSLSEMDINLPTDIPQVTDNITVDGVSWLFYHLTPFSALPSLVTTTGGIDLVVLGIIFETLVLVCPMILLGRYLSRKAIHAPNFHLLIWGHVIGIGLIGLLFFNYQFLDQTFGGLSYYAYPVVLAGMIGLWSMHLFNRSKVIEILKPDTMSGHRLRYLRWTQLVGEMKDGRVVIIDPRWRGFFYALLGHWTTLIPVASEATMEGRPAGADIENRQTLAAHEIAKIDKKIARARPTKQRPEDDFTIINAEDEGDPIRLFWVGSNEPVVVEFPHLSWTKNVKVPEKVDKHGVRVAAHEEPKLTWPHIVDGESTIRLAGIHYLDAPLAALGWSTSEDTFALLEKRAYAVYVLRSRMGSEADRIAEERLGEFLTLLESGNVPLTEDQAQQATERRLDPRDRYRDDPLYGDTARRNR